MSNTKRVFVIGPGQHVYDAAKKFGQRVDVLDFRANPFETDDLFFSVMHELFDKGNMQEDEFIVLGSNAILNAIAVAAIVGKYNKVNVLVYGAKHRDYTPRTIDLNLLMPIGG